MNKFFLYLLMLPSALWRSMGADTDQLRALLNTRLMLDDRKPMTIGFNRPQKQKKDRKYGTLLNSFIFMITGLVYMLPVVAVSDRVASLTLCFSFLLLSLTFMLITDFSTVLFDSRDKFILFPRPINDSTLVLARMLHIFIYLFRIILPLSLPSWIAIGIMDGWKSALLFIIPIILLVFIALFVVNGVYLLVLRLTKPEKFKDIINYFQVATSILFFISYYLLPRMFRNGAETVIFPIGKYQWVKFLPSYWLASCWSWIGYPLPLAGTSYFSAPAVICPLVCMYVLVKWLSPQFSRRMAGIDAVDAGVYDTTPGVKQKIPAVFYKKLAYAFNKSDDAKAGFMIAWLQSSRSRSFRMRVYPTFAFIPIYFIYMLSNGNTSISEAMAHLADSAKFLLLLYMSSFVMVSALTYLTMSDQYKAAWVYYSTPVAVPGKVMLGALKAIWIKYFLPFFIAISIFTVYIWGVTTIVDILLALVNVSLLIACIARVGFRHLPFSIAEQIKQGGARILKSFLVMAVPAALGGLHYVTVHYHLFLLKLIFMVLSAIFLWLVVDSYSNTTWKNMIKSEME